MKSLLASDGVTYNVKVVLVSGSASWSSRSGTHLANQLKFFVCKRGHSELLFVNGTWSPLHDGGNPADPHSDALIRTAM